MSPSLLCTHLSSKALLPLTRCPATPAKPFVLHICNLLHNQTMHKQKHQVSGKARQSHLGENQAGCRRRKHYTALAASTSHHCIPYRRKGIQSKLRCLKVRQYKEMQTLKSGSLVNLKLVKKKKSSDLPASPSPTVKTVEPARTA